MVFKYEEKERLYKNGTIERKDTIVDFYYHTKIG